MGTTVTALYGGAFDPFHNGHLATVALLLNSGVVNEVVVVPSGDRPDKSSSASGAHRLAMARLAVEESFPGDARVSVSDVHVTGKVDYGTIDVVDHYRQQGSGEVVVVIGQELLKDLPLWRESARLQATAKFLIIRRPGVTGAALTENWNIAELTPPYEDGVLVSSSSLRALLRKGASCAGLISPRVIRYCAEQGLYV
jgi:nicotinate-nucleotide adenylyltransferase